MTPTPQTEAGRLADALRDGTYLLSVERNATEAELRRLDAENQRLQQAHDIAVEIGAQYAAERDQLKADYQRLMEKHNNLHMNAKQCRAERDQLRAQVERLQGGESVAVIGPPNKQCHTCGFVGPEDVVMGCPKCGFDDMRAIKLEALKAGQAGGEVSDELIDRIADEYEDERGRIRVDRVFAFARAIIAALRAKEGK